MTPDLIEKGGGMPSKISHQAQETKLYDAGHDNPPFNNNMYASFDDGDGQIRFDEFGESRLVLVSAVRRHCICAGLF